MEALWQEIEKSWAAEGSDVQALLKHVQGAQALPKSDIQAAKGGETSLNSYLQGSCSSILDALVKLNPRLTWNTYPKEKSKVPVIKGSTLIGPDPSHPCLGKSDAVELTLIIVPDGCQLDQHAEDAKVVVHVLQSGPDAQVGPTDAMMRTVMTGEVLKFTPCAPKVIKAGSEAALILLHAKSLELSGDFWFSSLDSKEVIKEFEDVMEIGDIHEYYLKFAKNYDKVMKAWGYCMPEATVDAILKQCGLDDSKLGSWKILDLGCGDGWTGKALRGKGFQHITGIDFSDTMLEKSKQRGMHQEVKWANLLEPLPFEDNTFDCLISTAVTTYIKPFVLEDWIRVAKPDAVIAFTHKTSIWDEWEKEQKRLEQKKLWQEIWISDEPIPYLPSLKEKGEKFCTEMAKIYLYRKI